MNLKSKIVNCVFVLSTLFATSANAVLITLSPSSQEVGIFQSVSVDVFVSDLSDTQALGAFDLELLFDPNIVTLNSITFGSGLGFSFQETFSVNSGTQAVLESSLEFPSDLLAFQLSDFLLFTVNFVSTGFGETLVNLQNVILGDENGQEITDVSFNSANIRVSSPNLVNEPSHIALCLIALSFLAYRRKKMKS